MKMISIKVLDCLRVLADLHQPHYGDHYPLVETKRPKVSQKFFDARSSLLSYLIYRDALTDISVEGPPELKKHLDYLSELYSKLYSKKIELYSLLIDNGGGIRSPEAA